MNKKSRGNLIGLIVITLAAGIVMFTAGMGQFGQIFGSSRAAKHLDVEIPKALVATLDVQPEPIEIYESYTGMLRPFERYTLSFEVPGRIDSFGQNAEGNPFDVGDSVLAGQMLSEIDHRVYTAQLREARARAEQAQADLNRATTLRDRNVLAITDAEYQDWVTKVTLAESQLEIAEKNLTDTVLKAPVNGVISKRMINLGEYVSPQQAAWEILEVDQVLLVVGVPESQIHTVGKGQKVYVDMLARERFGERWPTLQGTVYRVGEAADDTTGLFEVQIVLPNPDRKMRPGQIAEARIVVDEIQGFKLPLAAAVIRDGQPLVFSIDEQAKTRSYPMGKWREQAGHLILPELPPEYRRVVVRGQHRLVEGRDVEIVSPTEQSNSSQQTASSPEVMAANAATR